MDDPIFLIMLENHDILPGDSRDKLETQKTKAEKAKYYIQRFIKTSPDLYLPKLLQAMEQYYKENNDIALQELVIDMIAEMNNLPHSSSYDLPPAKRIKYEDSDGPVSTQQDSQKRQQLQQKVNSSVAFWTNLNQKWQQCTRIPEKCFVTSAVEMDGKVYVAAIQKDSFSSFMYNVNKEQWFLLPELSKSYYNLIAVHSKKHLLAVGGSKGYRTTNEVYLLDEKHQNWITQYPNMPTSRFSITGVCYHSTVIVAGGVTQWNPWTLTRVVEILHIDDRSLPDLQWATVEQLPYLVYGAIPILCKDNLYISSFFDYNDLQDNNTLSIFSVSVPELLKSKQSDTVSSSLWKKLPDVPYSSYSIVCYQGRLITFTGFYLVEEPNKHSVEEPKKSNPILKLAPMIYIYNPDTLSWDCTGYVTCGYLLGRSVYIGENKIIFMGGMTDIYDEYNSDNWVHANLQLQLTEIVQRKRPSIIPY